MGKAACDKECCADIHNEAHIRNSFYYIAGVEV